MHTNDPASSPHTEPRELVTIALQITIGGQPVKFEIPLPSGPATWDDLLPFMRALVKTGSEISQEYAAVHGQTVSCRAGCGICCRQRVPLAEFEAHRLRKLVDSMEEPRRSEILSRFRSAEERVGEAGDAVAFDGTEALSLLEMAQRSARYFRLMIPCPFLEDESCSIYDERPLKCREYLVTSPAENCADPETKPVVGLPLPLRVYQATLFLDRGREASGIRWVPLDQLISWTDSHSAASRIRTGPELLHEFMTQLSKPGT